MILVILLRFSFSLHKQFKIKKHENTNFLSENLRSKILVVLVLVTYFQVTINGCLSLIKSIIMSKSFTLPKFSNITLNKIIKIILCKFHETFQQNL